MSRSGGGGGRSGGGGGSRSGGSGGGRIGGGGGSGRSHGGMSYGGGRSVGGGGGQTSGGGVSRSSSSGGGHHQVPGRQVTYQPARNKSTPVTGSDVARAQRLGQGLNAKPALQVHKHVSVPADVKYMAAQGHVQIKRGGAGCGGGPLPSAGQIPGRRVNVAAQGSPHISHVHDAQRYAHGINARGIVQAPKYAPVPASVRQEAARANVAIWKK